jgi:hypothetical protein
MSSHAELARELSPAARSFVQRLLYADVTQVIISTMARTMPSLRAPLMHLRWPPDGP